MSTTFSDTGFVPGAIAAADYPVAQTPILGGELQVWVSTHSARIIGDALVKDNSGGIIWTYRSAVDVTNTASNPLGTIVVAARGGGIISDASDTITYGGLTSAAIAPVAWSSNQSFTFPAGRAWAMTGSFTQPATSSAPAITNPGVGTGIRQGSMFSIIELPAFTTFKLAGVTSDRKVTPPNRGSKSIAGAMEEGYWTTPGVNKVGELEVTGPNLGYDDGLLRYAGIKCQALLMTLRENRLITYQAVAVDWTGAPETPYGAGETEATVTLRGPFNRLCAFPAPGGG